MLNPQNPESESGRGTKTLHLCVALLFAATLSVPSVHAATTITVQNTGDGVANAANCPGSGCRLRDAIAAARNGDTIDFSVTGTISVIRDGFIVGRNITISGPGAANLAIKGARSAVFFVGTDKTVTISGLTITNGAGLDGGGIVNDRSALRVFNCVLKNNKANGDGGAIANSARYGTRATLIVSGCTFSNNSAQTGGAISNSNFAGDNATVSVTFSTFDHNTARQDGGGICNKSLHSAGATVTVSNSTFSRNVVGQLCCSGRGGGIYNYAASGSPATVQIINSTFSDNSTMRFGDGGGIYNTGEAGNARLSISNSTFSGNTAGGGVGSIHNLGMGATATLINTIFNAQTGPSIQNQRGNVTSGGYNLSSDIGGGVLTGPGDQINIDPKLGPLQNNGGPTDTHALLSGSPGINAGDPHFDPNAFDPPLIDDQRGGFYARVVNDRIDIGAFEVQ